MNMRPFTLTLATLLSVVLIAPSAFFIAPQRTYAQAGVPTMGLGVNEFTTAAKTTFSAIKETLIQINTFTTAAAEYANYINAYILQPLAFVLSGNLMKMLTAGVLAFVTGKANGTGIPQFIVDVRKSMQTVSDGQALAYLRQVGQTNSPFASSIASALNSNYMQNTSLAGFWAANMCTLSRSSPNVPAYLAGNWSQGGVAAWFALTTQVQNNPYALYQNTQAQLGSVIGPGVSGVTGARQQELSWGQGFMSWCGVSDAATQTQNAASTAYQQCQASGKTGAECQAVFDAASGTMPTGGGINPGDACTNSDGTPGTIKTPGSVIKSTLDKVLGGQQDQILRMGNIGPQINQILGNIATVVQTVNFASSLLGGGDSGGLFGVGQTSTSNTTSRLAQFTPTQSSTGDFTSGYLGATDSKITTSVDNSPVTIANNTSTSTADAAAPVSAGGTTSDMSTRVQDYQKAWGAISVAANAASSTVQSLAALCTSYGNSSQAVAAQTALVVIVAPVLNQVAAVPAIASAALAQDTLVKSDAPGSTAYTTDLQKLQTMSPTYSEVSQAQYDATSYGGAKASPVGSLIVSQGSLTDQMNLIRINAEALKISACTAPQWSGGA